LAGCNGSQEIKERGVWIGVIGWEAIALQEQEVMGRGVGFRLGHQPRFADPRFPAEKDNLSLSTPDLINERMEVRKHWRAAN